MWTLHIHTRDSLLGFVGIFCIHVSNITWRLPEMIMEYEGQREMYVIVIIFLSLTHHALSPLNGEKCKVLWKKEETLLYEGKTNKQTNKQTNQPKNKTKKQNKWLCSYRKRKMDRKDSLRRRRIMMIIQIKHTNDFVDKFYFESVLPPPPRIHRITQKS